MQVKLDQGREAAVGDNVLGCARGRRRSNQEFCGKIGMYYGAKATSALNDSYYPHRRKEIGSRRGARKSQLPAMEAFGGHPCS